MSNTSEVFQEVRIERTAAGAFVKLVDRHGSTILGQGQAFPVSDINSSSPPTTSSEVGDKAGATVSVVEQGSAILHRSVLTLTATPITLTDDPGVGQYGTIKLYDFPAGNIVTLGAVIDAELTLNETWWVDASEGDVGLGTVATADGQALATTKQNIIATTAIAAMTAQVGPIDAQSTGGLSTGAAGGTDADLILNVRIDDSALHMPNVVTNGTMASDTGWVKGTGWTVHTVAAGKADCDGTQTDVSDLAQAGAVLVPGVSYSVAFTTASVTGGTVKVLANGVAGTTRSTAATFTETIVAGASGGIILRADADFVGTVDNVTATPLTGSGTITGAVTVLWSNAGDS